MDGKREVERGRDKEGGRSGREDNAHAYSHV